MLSSALIGCFTARHKSFALIGCFTTRLNVELCSDWLFHSVAHFSSSHSRKETQGGKYIFQYFLAQFRGRPIIGTDIKHFYDYS